jgi:tyrosyl-tRNA synthetase
LITKSDGSKFGKSEGGNVWLDPKRTSPYKFYQYWLNTSDQDAAKYIKIFTFLDKQTIEDIISQHQGQEHTKGLQKRLAQEVTTTVHGIDACTKAIEASTILFSKTASQDINTIDEDTFLSIFEGVPMASFSASEFGDGIDIIAALAEKTGFLKSNGEARRALKENSVSVNFTKVKEAHLITPKDLIHGKFVLLQRGKKNKFIIQVE